jgi:hypothetical protein
MLVLGIVLVLLAAGALLAALFGGRDDAADLDLGVLSVETTTMGVFLIGAATLLVFVIGLELIRSGTRRANRRRKERKELGRRSEKHDAHDDHRTGAGTGTDDAGTTSDPRRDQPPA